jgi:hypothetical protein
MKPSLPPDDANRDRDPLAAYADGDPDTVRAAAPREPSDAEWAAVRRRVHARLASPSPEPRSRRRASLWFAVAGTLTAAAAAVAWVVIVPNGPQPVPIVPETRSAEPVQPAVAVAPFPHEPQPDPLADYAVLPIAGADDVVLNRVPGDGWLPVGRSPLPAVLPLATVNDVELDDPDPAWPNVAPAPGYAPMIFAAKPR